MKPSETSNVLRQIAAAIDNSKQPDKRLVVADLKKVIANMEAVGQQEQVAIPKSDAGKGMLKKFLEDAQKALEKGDDSGFKGALEKALKNS